MESQYQYGVKQNKRKSRNLSSLYTGICELSTARKDMDPVHSTLWKFGLYFVYIFIVDWIFFTALIQVFMETC